MSERELRDRVETLYDELKQVRAELEVPELEVLAATRTRLLEEIAALEAREAELIERLPKVMQKIKSTRQAADVAEQRLREARSSVAAREDLGNPLAESRSNWEDQSQPPGCNLGVLLFATFVALALAAGWWS